MKPGGVLLDTNAVIRAQLNRPLRPGAAAAIRTAEEAGALFVSVVTAWEIAMLARNPLSRTGRLFTGEPAAWFTRLLQAPGVRLSTVGYEVAMASCSLPDWDHRDPADRLLIAQARELNVPLVTRDDAILDYAALGHVRAIPC